MREAVALDACRVTGFAVADFERQGERCTTSMTRRLRTKRAAVREAQVSSVVLRQALLAGQKPMEAGERVSLIPFAPGTWQRWTPPFFADGQGARLHHGVAAAQAQAVASDCHVREAPVARHPENTVFVDTESRYVTHSGLTSTREKGIAIVTNSALTST